MILSPSALSTGRSCGDLTDRAFEETAAGFPKSSGNLYMPIAIAMMLAIVSTKRMRSSSCQNPYKM
jgi:hypothetical protein